MKTNKVRTNTHRIHGAAIYGNMDPIPVMLALIYQHQPDPSWDMAISQSRILHVVWPGPQVANLTQDLCYK